MSRGFGRARFRRRAAVDAAKRQSEILDCLSAAGANLRRTAELAERLFATWPDDSSKLRAEIRECEHLGDELTRRIVHGLHRSEVRPFDRDDIHELAAAIDDVVDDVEEAIEETVMYRIEAPLEQAEALARVLHDAARPLALALESLGRLDEIDPRRLTRRSRDEGRDSMAALLIDPHLQAVRSREKEGDRIYRDAVAALFDGGIDPMLIIRWKDVLAAIEEAIDRCCNAADILERIVAKHSL
jgi:predicted phosphate transport protein (TIGR00153 family)